MIKAHLNHPSIVTWSMSTRSPTPVQERTRDFVDLAPVMYRAAKRLDPTRLVIDTAGATTSPAWTGRPSTLSAPVSEPTSVFCLDSRT